MPPKGSSQATVIADEPARTGVHAIPHESGSGSGPSVQPDHSFIAGDIAKKPKPWRPCKHCFPGPFCRDCEAPRMSQEEAQRLYEQLRRKDCHFALSMMAWRCRDRDGYDGRKKPCKHIKKAIPAWRHLL